LGALGSVFESGPRLRKIFLSALLGLGLLDVYRVHPNYLAYFNSMAGGPDAGYHWLKDSDQDWGQSLPSVGEYLKKHPASAVFLSYAGAGRPEAYGISYLDLFSPALTSRFHVDPPFPEVADKKPVFVVIGTSVLQTNPDVFDWLVLNRKPAAFLQGCFFIYDISNDTESFRWLARVFSELQRPQKAKWCLDQANRYSIQ
jgi:hypothetical protein